MKLEYDNVLTIQPVVDGRGAKDGRSDGFSDDPADGLAAPTLERTEDILRLFSIAGENSILEERDFGIVNGSITTNVPYSRAFSLRTLFAPPFASSNFALEGGIFGEILKTKSYTWNPIEVERHSSIRNIEVTTVVTLVEGVRALVFEIRLHNRRQEAVLAPLHFSVAGGLDFVTSWKFIRPEGIKGCQPSQSGDLLIRKNDTGAVVLGMKGLVWEEYCSFVRTNLLVPAGESASVWMVLAMGESTPAETIAQKLLDDPRAAVASSRQSWARKARGILENIPQFAATSKRLEQFYYRSALHLVLNRWEVPEFILQPFYSTGSVNGGCVCSYLWDFSEGAEIFPLADPVALKKHIEAFMKIDLTRHFSFNPLSGAGWGPWYYINQEKIVSLVYNYVLITGDTSFLEEVVAGKTILDWVTYHALFGDRLEEDANLIDYGSGNHHLELRREYRYDHVLPDLNARRYATYLAADALCGLAGKKEGEDLKQRAQKIKKAVREKMWSEQDKWWFFFDHQGSRHLRYTMQMFKVIGSGVLEEEEQALVDRLNEDEFLSEFGFHSISKKDPAYDQVDIDNGGGGACCCFPPQIIERLYKAGYSGQAADILQRILWWGDRLPYWSDSLVANAMDYRRDTPLQNAVGAVAGTQSIIFGMFGIKLDAGNTITINPVPPSFSPAISLSGLRIRGIEIAIEASKGMYSVVTNEGVFTEQIGTPTTLVIPSLLMNGRKEHETSQPT